ncbi:HsdM family class I SAM-dependent methyltransferase [Parasphingorhabdus cellanae]|uniref:site-specific DNA-methyltransferase (adenine-specific) n=1 Tax=Parasphingorhabdus cellanae TaxID=2806553 RepID=A0ABX7T144_9SPHN|nr:N-6 DNA methylase [Parasphingorhabdus cellanae]QTD54500.1 N-6 DNA methylase [Parasphingorhabdus cellanae]
MPPSQLQADITLSPEALFVQSVDLSSRKKLGQFFTPPAYANIMIDWIAGVSPESVLDPAIGTGLLIDMCAKRHVGEHYTGFDIDPKPLAIAKARMVDAAYCQIDLLERDFLATDWNARFDAIIANPPYIMHRDHDLNEAVADDMERRSGQRLSRQSNLYIYFVIKICEQLSHGGRAAILIPAEWMGANYGQSLKAYLLQRGLLSGLVTIDHAGHAFEDNMSTASILLIEKAGKPRHAVQSYYVPQGAEPTSLAALELNVGIIRHELPSDLLQSRKKWDMLLRQADKLPSGRWIRLRDLVITKRGIATGANRYFLMSREQAEDHELDITRMDRCVGKTAQVADITFSRTDFARLADAGQACFLFNPSRDLTPAENVYIKQGEKIGIPLKHGPRTKPVWYRAEMRPVAPIWASTFGRGRMRFIHNAAGVKALTCFHNLYAPTLDPIQLRALVALLNSDMMQEAINAQVRVLASGLMKLEPRDILDIHVPDIRLIPRDIIMRFADWLDDRPSDTSSRNMAALEELTTQAFRSSTK